MKMITLFILGFLVLSAHADTEVFSWQGHRGARGLYPENTIGSMKRALQYPISVLELDVVISKDNEVIVSHEPWMSEEICLTPAGKPVKDKEYNLYKMSTKEIQAFDCGSKIHPRFMKQEKKGEKKPRLIDLLSEMEKSKKQNYNIEIKSTELEESMGFQPDYKIFTDLVVKTIEAKVKWQNLTIQSFDWRVLKYLHEKYPKIQTVALIEESYDHKVVLDKLGFNPTIFSPNYNSLSKPQVEFFHARGIRVVPWTVNDIPAMRSLIAMGVDGIITDYPNLIQEVVSPGKLK